MKHTKKRRNSNKFQGYCCRYSKKTGEVCFGGWGAKLNEPERVMREAIKEEQRHDKSEQLELVA